MTHRERLAAAWAHQPTDRIPIHLGVGDDALRYRGGDKLKQLAQDLDNFSEHWGIISNGFFGLKSVYSEEEIENRPGEYRRVRRTQRTPAGDFTAITMHPVDSADYHWERRYVATLEDFRRLCDAPREPLTWSKEKWDEHVRKCGEDAYPLCALHHPLGGLVRQATTEEVFAWFMEEPALMHRFLDRSNTQIVDALRGMTAGGMRADFVTYALEMLIPPWMGHRQFDEFVAPYDRRVNAAIHAGGGRVRAHCHGCCGDFLTSFADMGVDATEPLEKVPTGDVDLAVAVKQVGDRMLLTGNIASERFNTVTREHVREEVRQAIQAGGRRGFTLGTSGASTTLELVQSQEEGDRMVANFIAYIEAGIEFGAGK